MLNERTTTNGCANSVPVRLTARDRCRLLVQQQLVGAAPDLDPQNRTFNPLVRFHSLGLRLYRYGILSKAQTACSICVLLL